MEGIITIIIIVISLITSANKAKQVKQNAPGQSGAPQSAPTRPVYPQTVPTRPAPSENPVQGTFAQQVSPKPAAPIRPAVPVGHQAVGKLNEGASRECEHGSVGGSMAYQGHTEGAERSEKTAPKPAVPTAQPMERPILSADEMRRAVIMAEILKRPQERMAEQSRRWNAR